MKTAENMFALIHLSFQKPFSENRSVSQPVCSTTCWICVFFFDVDSPSQLCVIDADYVRTRVHAFANQRNMLVSKKAVEHLYLGLSVFIIRIFLLVDKVLLFQRLKAEHSHPNSMIVIDSTCLRRILRVYPQLLGPLTGIILDDLLHNSGDY